MSKSGDVNDPFISTEPVRQLLSKLLPPWFTVDVQIEPPRGQVLGLSLEFQRALGNASGWHTRKRCVNTSLWLQYCGPRDSGIRSLEGLLVAE